MRALGRLGRPVHVTSRRNRSRRLSVRRAGTATVAMRRPAVPRPVLGGLVVVVVVLVYLGVVGARQATDAPSAAASESAAVAAAVERPALAPQDVPARQAATAADRSDRSGRAQDERIFGDVDGLRLTLPHASPLSIAFHEANRPEALAIDPVGELEANDNATRYIAPADQAGPAYRILSSRGRARPATSAVDIVMPDGSVAYAPVDGTVVEVKQYTLSGSLQDWRVVIQPDARKDLHVVLIHLHQPQVEVGDHVEAGGSAIGVARLLPFASHVDYVVGERHPHVHLEVKAATTAPRLDPNAPAVNPEVMAQGDVS
jgi:murein DD-endopeptidase MepM/ murein hydrolase activator NlpD